MFIAASRDAAIVPTGPAPTTRASTLRIASSLFEELTHPHCIRARGGRTALPPNHRQANEQGRRLLDRSMRWTKSSLHE
jgi:hypothetical protein